MWWTVGFRRLETSAALESAVRKARPESLDAMPFENRGEGNETRIDCKGGSSLDATVRRMGNVIHLPALMKLHDWE